MTWKAAACAANWARCTRAQLDGCGRPLARAAQDLLGCQDTLIGDELIGIKGISGGQKRRVSVGIEVRRRLGHRPTQRSAAQRGSY
jgi:hypothetical protein